MRPRQLPPYKSVSEIETKDPGILVRTMALLFLPEIQQWKTVSWGSSAYGS